MIVIINTALVPLVHRLVLFLFLFDHLKHTLLQVLAELCLYLNFGLKTATSGSSEYLLGCR